LIADALGPLLLPAELCESIPADFKLLISPHGLLQLLPVHAAILATGDYAAGRWAIQYLPTLALVPLVRPPSSSRSTVLLLGCEQDGFGDPPLREVPGELRSLAATWSSPPAQPVDCRLIPADGALAMTPASWDMCGYLHAACHGVFPSGRPFDAALRLGASSLRTSDFFGLRLDGIVASFSACALARHEEQFDERPVVGDEWIGMYLPLLYSGARATVASLWDAYSEPAARFMSAFHVALKRGDDPADAIRWAQDRTAAQTPQPATWANWYIVGPPPLGRTPADSRQGART
jgi:CHAT domain-containing protein